jgi:hypothetical protein
MFLLIFIFDIRNELKLYFFIKLKNFKNIYNYFIIFKSITLNINYVYKMINLILYNSYKMNHSI